jgi:hypothetical protein
MKLGKQEHDGDPLISLHSLFGPQGDGTQGFTTTGTSGVGGAANYKLPHRQKKNS